MKKLYKCSLFILPLSLLFSNQTLATNYPLDTLLSQVEEEIVKAKKVVEGDICLYECTIAIDPLSGNDTNGIAIEPEFTQRFFVLIRGEFISLKPGNYKKFIRRYLPEARDLHRQLGKRGFRYKNVPQMIRFYNRFYLGKGDFGHRKQNE